MILHLSPEQIERLRNIYSPASFQRMRSIYLQPQDNSSPYTDHAASTNAEEMLSACWHAIPAMTDLEIMKVSMAVLSLIRRITGEMEMRHPGTCTVFNDETFDA